MFELAMPWMLLLFFLPFLWWYLWPRETLKLSAALKIPFYRELQQSINKRKGLHAPSSRLGLLFLIWLLLVIALAGPRWVGAPIPLNREGRNLMLLLDLSESMGLQDMLLNGQPVSRLKIVKRAAEAFVQKRQGDRIGLILFGSQAYLQTPLTFDRENVLLRIEDASIGLAGKTTSIGDALGLGIKRLQDVPPASRVMILLTDGANTSGVLSPLKAAELAKDEGIKIYTIGLGTDPNALNNGFFAFNLSADLDEDTLKKISKMTGGNYFRATDLQTLQTIYSTIDRLENVAHEEATIRPQHDYYPWPLGLALCLFMYWLSQKMFFHRFLTLKHEKKHE